MKILYFLIGFIFATNCNAIKMEESLSSSGGVTHRQISFNTISSLNHKRQAGDELYCESAKIMMNAMINGTVGNLSIKEKTRLAYGLDQTKFLVRYYNAFNAMYGCINVVRYNFKTYPNEIENMFSDYGIYTIDDLVKAVADANSVTGTQQVMSKLSVADACSSNSISSEIDSQMATCITNISLNLKDRIEKEGYRALDMFKRYGVYNIKDLIDKVNGDYGLEYLYVILGYLISISVTDEE